MTRQFLIGRGDECQIQIQDQTQRTSRRHATLKIMDNGRIFISDHSSNGTFVNGVKVSQNVDFPIKRGDTVSFANTTELNWAQIPKVRNRAITYIVGAIAIFCVAILTIVFVDKHSPPPAPVLEKTDSVKTIIPDRQKMIDDSLRIVKIIKDSIDAQEKLSPKIAPKKPEPKKPEPDTTRTEPKPTPIL